MSSVQNFMIKHPSIVKSSSVTVCSSEDYNIDSSIFTSYTPQLLIWNITFFNVSTKEVENLIMNGFKIYDHSLDVFALLCE